MNKIVVVGEGGSGKDFFSNKFVKNGMRKGVLSTTRPIRNGEVPGIDYHYLTLDEFNEVGDYLCVSEFNDWKYGLSRKEWDDSDIIVLSPNALKQVKENTNEKFLVVYITSSKKTRRERMSKRKDADSVERRLKGDEEDFKLFTDFDIKLHTED